MKKCVLPSAASTPLFLLPAVTVRVPQWYTFTHSLRGRKKLCGRGTRKTKLTHTTANMKQNNSRGSCFDAFNVWKGRHCTSQKRLLNFANHAEKKCSYVVNLKPGPPKLMCCSVLDFKHLLERQNSWNKSRKTIYFSVRPFSTREFILAAFSLYFVV